MTYNIDEKIHRRASKQIKVGNVTIGGNSEISVQSMTNTVTSDVDSTVTQVINFMMKELT